MSFKCSHPFSCPVPRVHFALMNSRRRQMHFSCMFTVSPVKVTCRVWSLPPTGSSLTDGVWLSHVQPGAVSSEKLSESPLWGPSTSWGACSRHGPMAGGLEPPCPPVWNAPSLPVFPSEGYRKVCDVLTISRSSRETSDGESRDTMEEERGPSAQRNCPLFPRPRPPILQNRHLIFSISFRTTVFLSRM